MANRQKEIIKAWAQIHPDRMKDNLKAWVLANPEKKKASVLRARCKKAGTTVEVYNSLPKRCSFPHCKATEPGGGGNDWHMDHNHITKKFRGLLCHLHNKGLGCFHDSIEELQDAIDYLRKTSTPY